MVVSPHALLESQGRLRLHANYYITKQIIPALERVISLVSLRDPFSQQQELRLCQQPVRLALSCCWRNGVRLSVWWHELPARSCAREVLSGVFTCARLARTCARGLRPCPGRSACCRRSARQPRWASAAAPLQAP